MCVPKIKLSACWLILCAVLSVSASGCANKENVNHPVYGTLGYGLELLLTKFDIVSSKLQRMEDQWQSVEVKLHSINEKLDSVENKLHNVEVKQQSMNDNLHYVDEKLQKSEIKLLTIENDMQKYRSNQEQIHNEVFATIQKLEDQVALNLSEVHDRNQENINVMLHKLDKDIGHLQKQYNQSTFSSCKDVSSKVSGTYLIHVKNDSVPLKVYCEQKKFGGGWIVFPYRYDGSLDFYRGWDEFRDGFGDLNKEFWLGLEKVHQITSGRKHELVVELKDFSGIYKYVRYDAFEIGSESDQYDLKEFGNYTGTTGNSMYYNKGEKFSTEDRDNDENSRANCAQASEGAWWHNYAVCTLANLNGRYSNAKDNKSNYWFYFDDYKGLSYSRMMIRELE